MSFGGRRTRIASRSSVMVVRTAWRDVLRVILRVVRMELDDDFTFYDGTASVEFPRVQHFEVEGNHLHARVFSSF